MTQMHLSGLVSGVDTDTLVSQLMAIERRPLTAVQTRIQQANQQKTALQNLATRLLALRTAAQALTQSSTFQATMVRSSNENILQASGSAVSSLGSHILRVVQTAQASQFISSGMADAGSTPVGAGSISIELGNAFVNRATRVGSLNGGGGVDRGSIRITDRSGDSTIIDLSGATTIDDVLRAINNNTEVRVRAAVEGGAVVLTDISGSTMAELRVEEVGLHTTAYDLGILGNGGGTDTITGRDVMFVMRSTPLAMLNDGNGVSAVTGLDDFRVTLRDASTIDVNVSGAATIQDVINAINNDSENTGNLTASIRVDGKGLELVDSSGGGGSLSVTALNSSGAAADLGILKSVDADTLSGDYLVAGLDTVLLGSLNGGSGVGLGSISITDRAGNSSVIDLSSAQTLQDVIALINADATVDVTASVSSVGNSLLLRDNTGLTASNLIITDVDSTTAADLGIDTGGGGVAESSLRGGDLEVQYISENTLLSEMNGGSGVSAGRFKIIDRAGNEAIIDLRQPDDVAISDVIEEINASGAMVTAAINSTGDGIVITDTSGGSGTLRVEEYENGRTAADLNILGSAPQSSPDVINGSFEYKVDVSATATLNDVARAINNLGVYVGASVVNDGSGFTPYRLTVTSEVTGSAGRALIDPGDVPLSFSESAQARDAVLLLGSSEGGTPLAVVNSSNVITDLIPGLTLEAVSASSSPVTVTVTRDNESITNAVDDFVQQFNLAIDAINNATSFDADTLQRGILFGDSTVQQVKSSLYNLVVTPLSGAATGYNSLARLGIRLDDEGHLSLDTARLTDRLNASLTNVEALLGGIEQAVSGTTLVEYLRGGEGIRTVDEQDDIRITLRDGTTIDVDLSGAVIVQNILSAINNDPDNPGTLVARLSGDGKAIELVDSSTPDGVHELGVSALNGSLALNDLGLRADNAAAEDVYRGSGLGYLSNGVLSRIADQLGFLADESTGVIKGRMDGIDRIVDVYDFQVETLQRRLDATEQRLYNQFAQMELALSQLQVMQTQVSAIQPITWVTFAQGNE